VSMVDPHTLATVRSAPVGRNPLALALDKRRGRVYVANADDDTVTVLDAASVDVLGTLPVGQLPHALVVEPRSGCVYVANAASNSVSVVACGGLEARSERTRARERGVQEAARTFPPAEGRREVKRRTGTQT